MKTLNLREEMTRYYFINEPTGQNTPYSSDRWKTWSKLKLHNLNISAYWHRDMLAEKY